MYQKVTQNEWQLKDIQFIENVVLIKDSIGEIQIPCNSEFEESLRYYIDDQIKESNFLEWADGDCLDIVWLPIVLKEAIEERFNALRNRAAERFRRFKIGDLVSHKTFGQGTVVSFEPTLSEDIIEIKLNSGETQRFADDTGNNVKKL